MTHEEQRIGLINELQKEDNQLSNYPLPKDEQGQKDLLRALMNVRCLRIYGFADCLFTKIA